MAIETTTGGTVITGRGIAIFHLLQWKHAIALEARGIKFRKSVKAHAARSFGLSPRCKPELVLRAIERQLVIEQARMAAEG